MKRDRERETERNKEREREREREGTMDYNTMVVKVVQSFRIGIKYYKIVDVTSNLFQYKIFIS